MRDILRGLNQRPIAYYPIYRKIAGSTTAGILLSQLMYWFSNQDKIYKTDEDIMKETLLSAREIKTAKQKIKKLDFINVTREGVPAKTYYEIDWEKLKISLVETSKNENENEDKIIKDSKVSKPVWSNQPNQIGQIDQTGKFRDSSDDTKSVQSRLDESAKLESLGGSVQIGQISQTGLDESAKLERPNRPNQFGQIDQTRKDESTNLYNRYSETTTETTTETTLLKGKNRESLIFKEFIEYLREADGFVFSLSGKLGYSNEHKGFKIFNGYLYSFHSKNIIKSDEAFLIWDYLFKNKDRVYKLIDDFKSTQEHKLTENAS